MSPSPQHALARLRPARARIDLSRLASNYRALAAYARRPLMPVVKADAYGHGAAQVVARLLAAGAERLAVAYPEEGIALRRAGVQAPVLVLAGFADAQLSPLLAAGLTPVVSTPATLASVLARAGQPGPRFAVHLKLDTGMSRLGFPPQPFLDAARRLAGSARIELEGVMTHLASADEDADATRRQLDRFDEAVEALAREGLRPPLVHAANSAGLAFLRETHTLARPGLLLYGVRPRPLSPEVEVRPVMSLSADVSLVKDVPAGAAVSYGGRHVTQRPTRIATLPIGYADGVPRTRAMAETGALALRGARAPVAGTICMDLTMADVGALAGVEAGDEATLLGDAPAPDAWELAERAGTNAWQVLTGIGPRVPRVYLEDGRVIAVESRY
ncbi:MAG: alanine racemase [Vicinamibacteria bacterium]